MIYALQFITFNVYYTAINILARSHMSCVAVTFIASASDVAFSITSGHLIAAQCMMTSGYRIVNECIIRLRFRHLSTTEISVYCTVSYVKTINSLARETQLTLRRKRVTAEICISGT